jgi:hypothetical protein
MFEYAAIVAAVLSMLFSLGGGTIFSIIAAIFAFAGALLAYLVLGYGYLLIPQITKAITKTVVVTDTGYKIPPAQDAIVKNVNGIYYATVFLGIKFYETTERAPSEGVTYNEFFERAISNIKYVTKLGYIMYVEDISQKRKDIEARRAEAQLRLSRERDKPEPDVLRMDKLEREVGEWSGKLDEIIKGVKPMGIIGYASTTAVGVSEDAAIAGARTQSRELITQLANALNVEVDILQGEQMLRCFEWETFFPINPQELQEAIS